MGDRSFRILGKGRGISLIMVGLSTRSTRRSRTFPAVSCSFDYLTVAYSIVCHHDSHRHVSWGFPPTSQSVCNHVLPFFFLRPMSCARLSRLRKDVHERTAYQLQHHAVRYTSTGRTDFHDRLSLPSAPRAGSRISRIILQALSPRCRAWSPSRYV